MERCLSAWQHSVDRLWSSAEIDWIAAARLATAIAEVSEDKTLGQAASQALPILHSAAIRGADRTTREAARRRLGVIRDALHALTAPRFGQRCATPKQLTTEERYRQMLGLPLDCRLSAPEIHQAFKRAAKAVHPDMGGDTQAFLELSAARDALMKHGIRYR
jgi:hypothetical protein